MTKEDKELNQINTQKLTKEDKKFNQRSTQKLTKEDKELNREISSDDYSGKCQKYLLKGSK
ncbi:hypothetical protein AGMMS49936_02430 [Endomicrobiia bacterium]|nr:hypothetical protein AGMMS49936_02430 [Endomicrobiia bacterium]